MKLIFRKTALADLERIHEWIRQDSPVNARSVSERILDTIENTIVEIPRAGRAGKAHGSREWIVRGLPYIVVYRIDDKREAVLIVSILHGAQNR